MYYIQTKKPGGKWKTRKNFVCATLKDALATLEDLGVRIGGECRIVESYDVTVTRYKPVKIK